MANRRANKKVRALTRARMAATGESYQRALSRVRAEHALHRRPARPARPARDDGAVDLIECAYYGVPITLATFQDPSLPRIMVVPRLALPHQQHQQSSPFVWMRFLQPRGVQ